MERGLDDRYSRGLHANTACFGGAYAGVAAASRNANALANSGLDRGCQHRQLVRFRGNWPTGFSVRILLSGAGSVRSGRFPGADTCAL